MKKNLPKLLLCGLILNTGFLFSQKAEDLKQNEVYIGTYTKKEGHVDGKADGILRMTQNIRTGKLQLEGTAAKVVNPSFVKISPDGKNLYAVSELTSKDGPSGYVYSFKINPDHSLTKLGKLSSEAYAPCHVEIDKTGNYVFVSNYLGGIVTMYKRKADGNLKERKELNFDKDKSHTHSLSISADNKHAYVADLGLSRIWIFDLDAKEGTITPNSQAYVQLPAGTGPRHFTFSIDGKFAYSINELNSSVTTYEVKAGGGLEIIQNISSLPEDFQEKSAAADIHLHPSGKYLYVSNRGHNSIAAFTVNSQNGKLKVLDFTSTEGKTPRNFALSADGRFLYAANQDSGSISEYTIDEDTGKLNLCREPLEVKTPVCIEFE